MSLLYGKPSPRSVTRKFAEKHLTERCKTCNASKDQMCRGINGQVLKRTHQERAADVAATEKKGWK